MGKMDFYYQNHDGEIVYFYGSPFVLTDHTFFDWTLAYTTANSISRGFKLQPATFNFTLRLVPEKDTMQTEHFAHWIKRFLNIVAADGDTPGKLWTTTGDFMTGRIITSQKSAWRLHRDVTLKCVFQSDYPLWIKPRVHKLEARQISGQEYLDFPYGFPYGYGEAESGYAVLDNMSTGKARFVLRFGASADPYILLDGRKIGVNVSMSGEQYVEINGIDKTVLLYDGEQVLNVFDRRTKETSVFEPLTPGHHAIWWNGSFDGAITVYEERREPLWN